MKRYASSILLALLICEPTFSQVVLFSQEMPFAAGGSLLPDVFPSGCCDPHTFKPLIYSQELLEKMKPKKPSLFEWPSISVRTVVKETYEMAAFYGLRDNKPTAAEKLIQEHEELIEKRVRSLYRLEPFSDHDEEPSIAHPDAEPAELGYTWKPSEHDPEVFEDIPAGTTDVIPSYQAMDPTDSKKSDSETSSGEESDEEEDDSDKEEDLSEDGATKATPSQPASPSAKAAEGEDIPETPPSVGPQPLDEKKPGELVRRLTISNECDKHINTIPDYARYPASQAYKSRMLSLSLMLIGAVVGRQLTQHRSLPVQAVISSTTALTLPTVVNIGLSLYAYWKRWFDTKATHIIRHFAQRTDPSGKALWTVHSVPRLAYSSNSVRIENYGHAQYNSGRHMMAIFYAWAGWLQSQPSDQRTAIDIEHFQNAFHMLADPDPRSQEEQANSRAQFQIVEHNRIQSGHLPYFREFYATRSDLHWSSDYLSSFAPGFYLINELLPGQVLIIYIVQRPYQDRVYYVFPIRSLKLNFYSTTHSSEVEFLLRVLIKTHTGRQYSVYRLIDDTNSIADSVFPSDTPDEPEVEELADNEPAHEEL